MAKRKKCYQKQYMVWQTMQWLREKGVIRKSIHGMTENAMAKRKKVIRNSTWYDRQCNG